MDGANNRRRRRGSTLLAHVPDSKPQRKRCKFCRGFFTPNPNQARHDFCRDECRKNFHKYGALPLAKLKADLTREFARMIAAELAPLRADIAGLRLDLELMRESANVRDDPEAGEPASIDWESIDRANERAKRGGAGL